MEQTGQAEQKERLDIVLCSKGFAESREKAKQLILANCVYVDGIVTTKPSAKICKSHTITITNQDKDFVGRGAAKLEKAINLFNIDVCDTVAADVGASTGGFTDCLLQHGAQKVYAIDVGHDQLHQKLKADARVVPLEGVNFRYIDKNIFREIIGIVVCDVSFISLSLILPKIVEISHINTDIIVLIKPQFEAGKDNVGKNGIVKDKKIHLFVLNNFCEYCELNGLYIKNITFSPIKGGNGNIEYLAHLKKGCMDNYSRDTFKCIVKSAFESL